MKTPVPLMQMGCSSQPVPRRVRATARCLLLLASAACTSLWPAATLALDISGSSTIQPIVEKLVPAFQAQGGEPVQVRAGGSGAGVKNAIAGTSQIGMASRSLSAAEQAQVQFTTIGIDALAVVVHESNPLTAMTRAQLVDLYSGKHTNWQALGGPDLPVQRVSKEVGRSTLELFEHYTSLHSADRSLKPGQAPISKEVLVVGSNLEALTLVGGLPGAVGYVSVGTAQMMKAAGMPVKILPLDGVEPSTANILNRSYAIVRELNLVHKPATGAAAAFLALSLSQEGQAVVEQLGFVPITAR